MADLKTILGEAYQEGMTLDEINQALEGVDLIESSVLDGYVAKSTFDKTASEAADFKKKWRATQTEAELAAEAEAERQLKMEEELNALKKSATVSGYEKKYLGLGYDQDMASEISIALYENDMDTVFSLQSKFNVLKEKSLKAEVMKNMPGAISGNQAKVDYSKEIEAAKASGDMILTASLIRQQAEANSGKE